MTIRHFELEASMRSRVLSLGFGYIDHLGLVMRRQPREAELARAWHQAMRQRRGLQWGIGDLYNLFVDGYAEADQVANGLDLADISLATAQRYGHTCRRFVRDPAKGSELWAFRRRDLSFSHHSAVAGLVGKSAEASALAVQLLDRAESDRMTSAEDLEDAVRTFRAASGAGGATELSRAPAEVALQAAAEGSPASRLERLHAEASRTLDGLPPDWSAERGLVQSALRFLASAWESARNREVGGLPAEVLPVTEEVAA